MTRMSKQAQRRSVSPKAPRRAGKKTGPKKDHLLQGFKEKHNALQGQHASYGFIGKY